MDQVFVDPEKCMGCKSCEIACAVQHSKDKDLFAALLQAPAPMTRVHVEQAGSVTMPVVCRHCDDAPCMSACISGCLYKDAKGFVRRHKERCIGCWSCAMACPFGMVSRDAEKRIAVKCDRCHKLDVPACVNACPTEALFLADIEGMAKDKRHRMVLSEAPSKR